MNFDELLVLAQNYGTTSGADWSLGSSNGDGAVNFDDLLLLAQSYGFGASLEQLAAAGFRDTPFVSDWQMAQSMVPEPTSLPAGLALLSVFSRRAKRNGV